jgi:hypothetical protein
MLAFGLRRIDHVFEWRRAVTYTSPRSMSRLFRPERAKKLPSPLPKFGRTPPDLLIQIAERYLEEPSTTPLRLVSVCRHWYNTITAVRTLWRRVVIHINDREVIPKLLESHGLEKYLSRSDTRENYDDILLDIEIKCRRPSVEDHALVCVFTLDYYCVNHTCRYAVERREQLSKLLLHLAGPEPRSTADTASKSTLKVDWIQRWGTLSIEWDPVAQWVSGDTTNHPYVFTALHCLHLD